jgi:acetolactate synthase regulatory subunit
LKIGSMQIFKLQNYPIAKLQNWSGGNMQAFYIRYRNTQGTLMRILNAVSRRALDLSSVQAEAAAQDHQVVLLLEVTPKQVGQLFREWYAITDVLDVQAGAELHSAKVNVELTAPWNLPHPPASVPGNTEEGNAIRA